MGRGKNRKRPPVLAISSEDGDDDDENKPFLSMLLSLEAVLHTDLDDLVSFYRFKRTHRLLCGAIFLDMDVRGLLPRFNRFRPDCWHGGKPINQQFGHFAWHGTQAPVEILHSRTFRADRSFKPKEFSEGAKGNTAN